MDFWTKLFSPEGFMPRALCGTAQPSVMWWSVEANLQVWISYIGISFLVLRMVHRRRDVNPFVRWIGFGFFAFIFLCGQTHLIGASMYWQPAYRLDTLVVQITAQVSTTTWFLFWRFGPYLMTFRTEDQITRAEVSIDHLVAQVATTEAIKEQLDKLSQDQAE